MLSLEVDQVSKLSKRKLAALLRDPSEHFQSVHAWIIPPAEDDNDIDVEPQVCTPQRNH